MALKKSDLYKTIWDGCDQLRGGMDASQYKDYVLVLLFIKYVSDKYANAPGTLEIPKGASFQDLVKLKGNTNIGEKINTIIERLAEANDLNGVINLVDFNSEEKLGKGKEMQDRLTNLIAIFENPDLDFSKNRADGDDILGDAYEYLMRKFATQSGKSKGQFYTPAEVSRIMAQVIGIKDVKISSQTTIYDPTCGSGSLLLKVADEMGKNISIYGQEMDNATCALAKMNMILHNYSTAEIEQGNTLANPSKFGDASDAGELKTFNFAVANPPFSNKSWQNGLNTEKDIYGRFDGYGVPPAKNGDYAFLLHFIHSLKSTGKGAIILPHGVLFRGNVEGDIRQNIIKRGYIKGIIGLPPNLFYGTGIPACIIVIDKEKANKRQAIFMIDASKGFMKDGDKNRLREQDIHKIVDVFNNGLEIPKYSRLVPISEIEGNDYNLNIPRYIDSQDDEDVHNIKAHLEGGIPVKDIDDLADYWLVCPGLRERLFMPMKKRKGFCQLRVSSEGVKDAIFSHAEFMGFTENIDQVITSWQNSCRNILLKLNENNKAKDIIIGLSESLLTVFDDVLLVDKYDFYQHLMIYWEEVMKDDVYLIIENGWVVETFQVMDKNGKPKKDEWDCNLLPKSLVIDRFFGKERANIDLLEADRENNKRVIEELVEEYAGEDGYFDDLRNDKGKLTKKNIEVRVRELKKYDVDEDELLILSQYLDLMEVEVNIDKQIKDAQKLLDDNLRKKYNKLTEKEIKSLVIDDKWMASIRLNMNTELERISQGLTGRIKVLADRYVSPLPELIARVDELSQRVNEHLQVLAISSTK